MFCSRQAANDLSPIHGRPTSGLWEPLLAKLLPENQAHNQALKQQEELMNIGSLITVAIAVLEAVKEANKE